MANIQILFCKTALPFSTAIMFFTGEPVSHVAVTSDAWDKVYHSDLLGLHGADKDSFMSYHQIVFKFTINLDADVSDKFLTYLRAVLSSESGNPYDIPALVYFGYRCALHKFGAPYPKENPLDVRHTYLCVEVVYLVNETAVEVLGQPILSYDVDLGMTMPGALYEMLRQRFGGHDEIDFSGNAFTYPSNVGVSARANV